MALTPAQEAAIEVLEEEIGRPLTTSERQRAEVFVVQYEERTTTTPYGQGFRGTFAEALDRASYGIFSPGATFEGGRIPTPYEMAIAVGGFVTPDEVIYEGFRADTPALYADRLREEVGVPGQVGTPTLPGETPPTIPTTTEGEQQAAIDAALAADPGLAAIYAEIQAQQDEEEAPKYLGGIPQGTLLPQNYGEVAQQWAIDMSEYNRVNAAENAFTGADMGAPGWSPKMNEITYGSPSYLPMDQFSGFATKDPGYINTVQQGLVAAGLMDEDDYMDGVWTQDAAKAMEDAMIEANYTGGSKSWVDIVQQRAKSNAGKQRQRSGGGGGGGGGRRANPLAGRTLVLPPYEEPNIDILNTQVRDLMSQRLGRDPTGWELTLLADSLSEGYKAQYDAEVKTAKANFEAGNRAILQSVRTGKPVTVTAEKAERVDPLAHLQGRFEERYAPEMALNESRENSRETMSNVFNVLTQTSRILGGAS